MRWASWPQARVGPCCSPPRCTDLLCWSGPRQLQALDVDMNRQIKWADVPANAVLQGARQVCPASPVCGQRCTGGLRQGLTGACTGMYAGADAALLSGACTRGQPSGRPSVRVSLHGGGS